MRKYLIAAVAALTALCFTAVAIAQGGATSNVKVSPKDAGTKARPKASAISLEIKNSDTSRTASVIDISIAKNVKLSLKGIKKCDLARLSQQGTSGCSKSSIIGSGTADARAGVSRSGVYEPNPGLLPFKVTPYAANASKVASNPELRGAQLAFYLEQRAVVNGKPGAVLASGIKAIARGVIKRASGKYGSKLVITIPEVPAQQYPAGAYNGLEKLKAVLKKGKMVTTVGCKARKHPFKSVITFVPNPDPAKAGKETTNDNAPCTP